jgi:proline iminopeptidase
LRGQTTNFSARFRGFATSGVIVQGRYDVVCPMESAWALHRAWPEAEMIITADGGHSATDPANSRALVAATDRFVG